MAIRYAERLQMKSTVRASVVAAVVVAVVVVWCGNLAAREFERLAVPAEIIDPPWLAERRQAQIAAAKTYGVYCNFGFSDTGRPYHEDIFGQDLFLEVIL